MSHAEIPSDRRREERRESAHANKRIEILAAARRVLARVGAKGLTIRAVAAEAGYVPGAVYFYFHSKAAILSELAVSELSGLDQATALDLVARRRRARRGKPPKSSPPPTRSSNATPTTAHSPGSERALLGPPDRALPNGRRTTRPRAPAARTSAGPRARPLLRRHRPRDARPHGPPGQTRRHRGQRPARSRPLPKNRPRTRRSDRDVIHPTRSNTAATPWPPPTHIVSSPSAPCAASSRAAASPECARPSRRSDGRAKCRSR